MCVRARMSWRVISLPASISLSLSDLPTGPDFFHQWLMGVKLSPSLKACKENEDTPSGLMATVKYSVD